MKVAGNIDEEVKILIDRAYDHCRKLLTDHADKLQKLSDYLLANESISGEQFARMMEGKELGEATQTVLFDGFEEPKEQEEPRERE